MSTGLSGLLITDQISEDSGVTWKTIICLTNSTITGGSASTSTVTRCGTNTTTTNNATTVSGEGEIRGDVASTEISYLRLQQLRDAGTIVQFKRQNTALNTIAVGEIDYAAFDALITEVTASAPADGVFTFTWSVTSTGPVDWNISS